MGNSTGSTMYMFGAVIVIYIVGMLLYQGFQWIKKKRAQKKDEEFRNSDKYMLILNRIKRLELINQSLFIALHIAEGYYYVGISCSTDLRCIDEYSGSF